jgi:predicted phage-related endonuclease
MAAVDVLELYDKLRLAPDEEARARLIAQAFSLLEARYPHLDDLVTTRELSTSELKLIKEIELVRGELKETELRLIKEIEAVRGELKETELRLIKEIESIRAETEKVRAETEKVRAETEKVRAELKVDIARSHAGLLKWSFLFWASQLGALLLLFWRLTGKG